MENNNNNQSPKKSFGENVQDLKINSMASPLINQNLSSNNYNINVIQNNNGNIFNNDFLKKIKSSGLLTDSNRKFSLFGSKLNEKQDKKDLEELSPEQIRLINFEKFIKEIKSGMAKCKYRKTLEEITAREDIFFDMEIFWQVREYKIKCLLKILERKIFKSDAPAIQKQKSIETWILKLENEIEIWIGTLDFLRNSETLVKYEEQIESLIHVILEEFYLQAQFKFSLRNFHEAIAILGLGERIIKYFCSFSRSVKVFLSAQKLCMFISSFLISDNDFLIAKEYQNMVIKFAFSELFLRNDIEDGILYEDLSKTNQYYLNKIFFNIINAYYQRGVCEENLGDLQKAIDSYKQGVWFANNFLKYQYPEICQYIFDVEQRSKQYHQLIKKICEKFDSSDYIYKYAKKAKKLFKNENEQGMKINNAYPGLKYNKKNNKETKKPLIQSSIHTEEIKNFIDSVKHQEFEFLEDTKKSENIKQLMSTVNLLNNFSSEKFRDIIKIMPHLSLEKLDKTLIDKIQKRLNDIRADKTFSDMEKLKAESKNKNRILETNNQKAELEQYLNKDQKSDINANLNLNFDKNYNISLNMILNTEKLLADRNTETTYPTTRVTKTNLKNDNSNNNTNEGKNNSNEIKKNSSYAQRPHSSRIRKDPSKKIDKYYHDEYIFSSGFQNKLTNINELMKKETEFQKKLLRLKKYEKLPLEIKNIDMNSIKEEVNCFFDRAKSTYRSGFTFSNDNQAKKSNTLKDIDKNKKEKYKQKLEIALIKSLDTRVYSLLDQVKKMEEKSDNLIREEFINFRKNDKLNKLDFEKLNSEYEKKIEKELSFLDKKEKMCKKIIEDDIKNLNSDQISNNKNIKNNNIIPKLYDMRKDKSSNFNRPYTAGIPMTTRNLNSNKLNLNCDEKKTNNEKFKKLNSKKIDVDKFIKFELDMNDIEKTFPTQTVGRNGLDGYFISNSMNSN